MSRPSLYLLLRKAHLQELVDLRWLLQDAKPDTPWYIALHKRRREIQKSMLDSRRSFQKGEFDEVQDRVD